MAPRAQTSMLFWVQVWCLTPLGMCPCVVRASHSLWWVGMRDSHSVSILTLFGRVFQYFRAWDPYAVFSWVRIMFYPLEEFAQYLEGGREGGTVCSCFWCYWWSGSNIVKVLLLFRFFVFCNSTAVTNFMVVKSHFGGGDVPRHVAQLHLGVLFKNIFKHFI